MLIGCVDQQPSVFIKKFDVKDNDINCSIYHVTYSNTYTKIIKCLDKDGREVIFGSK